MGLTLGFVEEPQSFKIFFAKHNLSSFKFSTKVWERNMLVNTPILDGYTKEDFIELYEMQQKFENMQPLYLSPIWKKFKKVYLFSDLQIWTEV